MSGDDSRPSNDFEVVFVGIQMVGGDEGEGSVGGGLDVTDWLLSCHAERWALK